MPREPVDNRKLLKQVSRSFYLTLRILPGPVRNAITIAYLLARASDTVADTRLIAVSRRRQALSELRGSLQAACEGKPVVRPDFGDLAEAQEAVTGEGTPGERVLLERVEEVLQALRKIEVADQQRILKLLSTILDGQENDLVQFDTDPGKLKAFATDQDLDSYTYAVAGCVGEFWTEMCRAHLFPEADMDDENLHSNGIRFGKGLQLVNILRDLPMDLRRGRCYIPESRLSEMNLRPQDLLNPSSMDRFRPLYETYLNLAADSLSAGWKYTLSLPFGCCRIRLACAWPALIGIRTLKYLSIGNVLDDRTRIKISRAEIRGIILRSIAFYLFPAPWSRLFERLGKPHR